MAKQNNELLMKNHESRPSDPSPLQKQMQLDMIIKIEDVNEVVDMDVAVVVGYGFGRSHGRGNYGV